MREVIGYILTFSLAGGLLWHFILIAVRGQVTIQENNPYILGAEIGLVVFCIIFGLWNTIAYIRRYR